MVQCIFMPLGQNILTFVSNFAGIPFVYWPEISILEIVMLGKFVEIL